MSIIVQDLLRSSFRCINRLQPGFIYSPEELADGLFILNSMLDSWATDDLNAFCTLIQTFTFQPGVWKYSIGPGGTFNGARPTEVTKATLVILTNPDQPLRMDIELLNSRQYQSINLQETPSLYAQKMNYNPTYASGVGQGTCNFWPVPQEADNVELSSMQMLGAGFTAGSNVFDAPPGYQEAVRYNLAVRLAMEFDQPLKPGVAALATESLAMVQRKNAPTPQMDCDLGMLPNRAGRGGWNRLTGDFDS